MTNFPIEYFGPHHADVIEVIEFALSGRVAAGIWRDPASSSIELVDSLAAIDEHSAVVPEVGENEIDWRDFLEYQRAPLVFSKRDNVSAAKWEQIERRLANQFNEVERDFERLIHWMPDGPRRLAACILYDCAYARAVCGRESKFWELVFEGFLLGGVPVGWVGRWPDGALRVYVLARENSTRDA